MARAKRFSSNNKAVLSARGGHRVVSAATKAKIAASLRGNKNAFRGGPKHRLSHREKVANINARTKENKANLSDAQLRQRSAVAKRLRARARAEEAGIKLAHSQPIPTTNTITQRDSKLRADASRARGSIAKAETKSAGRTEPRRNPEAARAAQARQNRDMANTKEARRRVENARKQGTITTLSKEKLSLERAQQRNADKRAANANTGNGNFNKQNDIQAANRLQDRRENNQIASLIAAHDDMITQKSNQLSRAQKRGNKKGADQLTFEIAQLKKDHADLQSKLKVDRSKPSTDPLTKATSKPRALPKASPETVVRAYKKLAKEPEDFVRLSKLRPLLGGSREDQDKAIHAMTRSGMVHLAQSANQKALTSNDHVSSIRIGSESKHLIAIEDVYTPKPLPRS